MPKPAILKLLIIYEAITKNDEDRGSDHIDISEVFGIRMSVILIKGMHGSVQNITIFLRDTVLRSLLSLDPENPRIIIF